MKTEIIPGRLTSTLAVYRILKKNVLATDPTNFLLQVQTGAQQSQGVEFDLTAQLTDAWKLIATYAYTDARIAADTTFKVGNREAVLARLHAQGDKEFKYLVAHGLKGMVLRWLTRRNPDINWAFLRDKLVPLHPDKCRLAYVLCRSLNAQRVVEFGTSFGVSTIYLAAAVRDNAAGGTRRIVIGTEIEPTKAAAARSNLAEAGLANYVEVREGDALETLRDVGGPADFLLMDSWTRFARPIIEIVAPQLRPGAIVMADNVPRVPRGYRQYIDYVRNPANGFRSMRWPYKGGVELSVRVS